MIKIQETLHYTKFRDSAILLSKVGQVETEIRRTAHVLAWMLQDENTWSKNSKNRHPIVLLTSNETRFA